MSKFLLVALGLFFVGCIFVLISDITTPKNKFHAIVTTPTSVPTNSVQHVTVIQEEAQPAQEASPKEFTVEGFVNNNGSIDTSEYGNGVTLESSHDNGKTWQKSHQGISRNGDSVRYCESNKSPRKCLYVSAKWVK